MTREIFFHYNYIGEIAGLIIAGLMLLIMLYSKPKDTFVYKYIFYGTILSIVSILVHISIIFVANNPENYYNKYIFMAQLMLFLIVYMGILYCIFSYVNMMSIVRRKQRKEFLIMYGILTLVYLLGVVIEIAASGLYKLGIEGIDIRHFTRYYCCAGIVCTIFCFNATLSNKNSVSRVIKHSVFAIAPLILTLLIAQIVILSRFNTIFTALTYVPVFLLGYMLFHSNPYDEVTGAQGSHALNAYMHKNLGKRNIYVSYVKLTYPGVENLVYDRDDLILKGIAACRSVESISNKVKIFRVSEDKYVNIIETDKESEFLNFANQIRGVFDAAKTEVSIPINYIIVSGKVDESFDEPLKCRQFYEYISRKFKDLNSSHFYLVKPTDYSDFMEDYEITKALEDIRNRLDLDDERIVVYAQPIYSVDTGSFRVAEALTRLKLGDKIINPDKFIPIAENSGTIHAVTCIVLNKVCRVIESIENYYDFDAISINVSSKEISQNNAHIELFEIINNYEFDTSKIRLEITESAMFENFDVANENMKFLSRAGIQFYLDDFGTGYSSLERVMECPFRTIKFDKTLLYKSLDDNRMDDIMTYMIEVFKKNGFVTLVEGVEDESQSQYSLEHGFDYIQGYHYAKPEPIERVKKYFNRKTKF